MGVKYAHFRKCHQSILRFPTSQWQLLKFAHLIRLGGNWFLSIVAERPPKVAVGFNPRSAITPNNLVAERRLNHRHTIGHQVHSRRSPRIPSSLRDESFPRHRHPRVETHGYHQMSLRDWRRRPISGEVNRSPETGFADTFDQLDQGGSFQGSARATHQDDQSGERSVADQRQEIIPVTGDQDVAVVIRESEDFVVLGCRRQDLSQMDDLVAHRFQSKGGIFGDVVVKEEDHASVCI
jgi:hypothetical protein